MIMIMAKICYVYVSVSVRISAYGPVSASPNMRVCAYACRRIEAWARPKMGVWGGSYYTAFPLVPIPLSA